MKDFDVARAERLAADREFKLGGEIFTRREGVSRETVVRFMSLDQVANEDFIREQTAVLLEFLDPECHERFLARISDDVDPIFWADFQELGRWFIEEETRRPTSPSSASSAGRSETATTRSTEDSPSPATASNVSG